MADKEDQWLCAVCHQELTMPGYKCVGHDDRGETIYTHPGACYDRRGELKRPGVHIALPYPQEGGYPEA